MSKFTRVEGQYIISLKLHTLLKNPINVCTITIIITIKNSQYWNQHCIGFNQYDR